MSTRWGMVGCRRGSLGMRWREAVFAEPESGQTDAEAHQGRGVGVSPIYPETSFRDFNTA
jgi:hypothetical protein